jgi:hypothetical protein
MDAVGGDFNADIAQNKVLLVFMMENCNLDCVIETSSTLGNTSIALTVARHVSAESMPYTSYFFRPTPVLNARAHTHTHTHTQNSVAFSPQANYTD